MDNQRAVPVEGRFDPETGFGAYEIVDVIEAHEVDPDSVVQSSVEAEVQPQAEVATPDMHVPTPKRTRRPRAERHHGRIRNGIRHIGMVGAAGLMVLGALQVAEQFGFDFGDVIPGDKAGVTGTIDNVRTDVEEMHGIVTAELTSTVDVRMKRTLNHINPIPDCNIEINERKISLSGLLVVGLDDVLIEPSKSGVTATVSKFETPKLGLPLDKPVLSNAFSASACMQKDGKEKIDSPENVPVVLTGKLLKASSLRIGECVINKANDKGSDVQRLLTASLQESIAEIRGLKPDQVSVIFDFEDTDRGEVAIRKTQ